MKNFEVPANGFRCPFEIKGENEGTIIEVPLSEDKEERFFTIQQAFEVFHQTPESPAVKFKTPPSLHEKCNTIEDLKVEILPYQTEILGAEMAYRLSPFLQYQLREIQREEALELFNKFPYKFMAAQRLESIMSSCGVDEAQGPEQISNWIYSIMSDAISRGIKDPRLVINDEIDGHQVELLVITPGSVIVVPERHPSTSGSQNQNVFSIVKSPFYPKPFGRYSDDIEIVMSRETDFSRLSKEARQKIRTSSNAVLQDHGILIEDLQNDKIEGDGVWIPKYGAVESEPGEADQNGFL